MLSTVNLHHYNTVVVQVGDILDRGDNELAIMRKIRSLTKQAREAGGDFITLNGNHEIMNVLGDFRYATRGSYKEMAAHVEKRDAKLVAEGKLPLGTLDKENMPANVDPKMYAGVLARKELFKPGGEVAMQMANNPTVLQVDDIVFAHAGIDQTHVEYGLERINNEVSAWMAGYRKDPPKHVMEEKGVVWTRDYGGKVAVRRCRLTSG